MTYNPIRSVTVTLEDGTQQEFGRCDPLPTMFASEDGTILSVEEQHPFLHGRTASVRQHGRIIPVKYLVADAVNPGWERDNEAIEQADTSNPFDCSVGNLRTVEMRGRGRPRGNSLNDELTAVEVARTIGSLSEAVEELGGIDEVSLAKLVLKWHPKAILEFEDIPPEIQRSTQYANLALRYGV